MQLAGEGRGVGPGRGCQLWAGLPAGCGLDCGLKCGLECGLPDAEYESKVGSWSLLDPSPLVRLPCSNLDAVIVGWKEKKAGSKRARRGIAMQGL